ncbi:stearoyl-CoA desaturase [Actinomadura rubrobrunea]|uniref:Stearoyl-CoA desaturase n=1 Tax=Actinomadura rubrobrunea TaxID=115335 RepID=A0A9W6PV37_9ACTN|nr:acyl-CoA desaturase [Actinomadura rubrobrunea]GLW63546.1 stearoyl-CoA desaturase [Actinomadura rubrobrunea]
MTVELTGSAAAAATGGDTDRAARRLAYVTVCVPAAGFVAAVAYAWRYGFTVVDGLLLAVMYLVTAFGVEGGMHRFFSHRAFSAGRVVTALWGVAGSMAAQGPIVFWVATHRIHHAFTDTDRDPHSPRPIGTGPLARVRGLWHGHVGWLFTVRRDNWSKHVPDLLADRTVMRVNELYFVWVLLGLALPAALGGLLTWSVGGAVSGLLWGGLARIFLLDQVTWGVNSIGHTLGSRPYKTRDNSRNVAAMAPFSVGGSWHNNHHARPSLAHNRHAFWQIDLTGMFITLLDRLGLIHDVRYPKSSGAHRRAAGRSNREHRRRQP